MTQNWSSNGAPGYIYLKQQAQASIAGGRTEEPIQRTLREILQQHTSQTSICQKQQAVKDHKQQL